MLVLIAILCLWVLVLLGAGVYFWASQPGGKVSLRIFCKRESHKGGQLQSRETLGVLSWNVAFGNGLYSDPYGYRPASQEENRSNLTRLCEQMVEADPDLVLLQEIDFLSRPSFDFDQFEYFTRELSEKCGLHFAVGLPAWSVRHLPYPLWPLTKQMGRINRG